MSYYLDSYAMLSYLEGNKSLSPYFEEENLVTSSFNIAELYYHLLSRKGEQLADEWTIPFVAISSNPSPLTIKNAMKFRLTNKKKSLSYADCIGYQMAKERNLKFLTGDIQFKGLPNVEFVK
jgi:hypothetical protein